MPEFLSAAFLSALLAIVLIDLVLAGDNALIIGLVARNLPKDKQKQVIFWGTFGAIAVRALMALLVVYILDLPGFMLAGGLALIWIARKLLEPDESAAEKHFAQAPAQSFDPRITEETSSSPRARVDSTQSWPPAKRPGKSLSR